MSTASPTVKGMPRSSRARQIPTKVQLRREALLDRLVDLIQAEGFAHLSLDDYAQSLHCSKSTLYGIADTKERIVMKAVRRFFARATSRIEGQLARSQTTPVERIREYLLAIADELAPASPEFFSDLDGWESTKEIYRLNTRAAAARVMQMVNEAVPERNDAAFLGAIVGQIMESIHRGDIEQSAGLDDAEAYRSLADLIVRGLMVSSVQNSPITQGHAS